MKKETSLIAIGILAQIVFLSTIKGVSAQISGVNDTMKTPSSIQLWVEDKKKDAEKAMEWVTNSKMGQLVGDGITAAKDGASYLKNAYDNTIGFYNQIKDDIKNSTEYKAAQLSKSLAEEAQKTKDIEAEKKEKIAEQEELAALAATQCSEKIAAAGGNITTAQDGENQALEANQQEELEKLRLQCAKEQEKYAENIKTLESEYKNKLTTQAEKTAEIGNELQALYTGEEIQILPSEEALANAKEALFLEDGAPASIENEKAVRTNRYKIRRETIYDVYETALRAQADLPKLKDDVESNTSLGNVMSGESEASGVHTQVMAQEVELLYKYAEMIVNDLVLESTVLASSLSLDSVNKEYSKFNLCEYSEYGVKDTSLKGQISQAKASVSNLADKVSSTYQSLKDKANDVKNKVDETKEKVETVKSQIDDAKTAVDNLKETGSALQNVIQNPSVMEGMI